LNYVSGAIVSKAFKRK